MKTRPDNSHQEIEFHTGLMASDYYRFPKPPYEGNGWSIDLVLPGKKYRSSFEAVGNRIYSAKEVIIRTRKEIHAQRAANLIHSAMLLLDASTVLSHLYPGEHAPICRVTNKSMPSNLPGVSTSSIPLACLVAARASRRLEYIYALAKIRLSMETQSIPMIDLDPYHSENIPKSLLPEEHVRMAFSIVTAWSAVEEIGFEIRASSKKPSKLSDGSWNPEVRQELESRLIKGHINLNETVSWNLRGPRTRIEKKRAPSIATKARWQSIKYGTVRW